MWFVNSGSEDSVSMKTSSRTSPVPPEPPALPPKMNKTKQVRGNCGNYVRPWTKYFMRSLLL